VKGERTVAEAGDRFPALRLRRLRARAAMRGLVRETRLHPEAFIYPLFVVPGRGVRRGIPSLPGQFHLSPDEAAAEAEAAWEEGVRAFLLFGRPPEGGKDPQGSGAWDPEGAVQQALRVLRARLPEAVLVSDVCLCAYTTHGHCGVVDPATGAVDNDATLPLLARTAVSHAEAGADVVAPSDMMDGRVAAIRRALDEAGFARTAILSYAAKFASGFYGPFREAEDSAPAFGDRRGYQLDPADRRQAVREVVLDAREGADLVMVKPALAYLDVLAAVRARVDLPVVAYNVSGEYAMVRAAEAAGWADGPRLALEVLLAIRRAGADAIITYHAREVARLLRAGVEV
jgi:porphobilinogen synthase